MSEATQSLGKVRCRKAYPEIDAMKRIDDLLTPLPQDVRVRVLRWVCEKYFSKSMPSSNGDAEQELLGGR